MHIFYWLVFLLFMIFSFPYGTQTVAGWRGYGSFAAWFCLVLLLAFIGIKVFPFPWGS